MHLPPRIALRHLSSVCAVQSVPPGHLINMHCGRLLRRRLRHNYVPGRKRFVARAGYIIYNMEYGACQTRTRSACPVKGTRRLYLSILVAILLPCSTERISDLAFFPIRHKYAGLI
jgi:hypothetical protein